jgi:hypothetical protein
MLPQEHKALIRRQSKAENNPTKTLFERPSAKTEGLLFMKKPLRI